MIVLTNLYFSRANTARIFRVSKKHIVGRAITRNFSYTCSTINTKNKRTNLLSRIVGSHMIVQHMYTGRRNLIRSGTSLTSLRENSATPYKALNIISHPCSCYRRQTIFRSASSDH